MNSILCGLCNSSAILATLKILIDIDIEEQSSKKAYVVSSGTLNLQPINRHLVEIWCVMYIHKQTAKTTTSIPTKFCSTIKISKCTSLVAHQGQSLLSTIALFLIAGKRQKFDSDVINMEVVTNRCV